MWQKWPYGKGYSKEKCSKMANFGGETQKNMQKIAWTIAEFFYAKNGKNVKIAKQVF